MYLHLVVQRTVCLRVVLRLLTNLSLLLWSVHCWFALELTKFVVRNVHAWLGYEEMQGKLWNIYSDVAC